MITKILQLQKRDSYVYQNIQDKAAWNTFNHVYALADGTTQSINSERWAAMITEDFVAKPTFNSKEIIDLFTDTARKFSNENYSFSSNPAIAALEKAKISKGASTTFLGLQFLQNNYVNVISCGDTNLFIFDDKRRLIKCFPYKTVKAINTNNNFINTTQLEEKKIDTSYFQVKKLKHSKTDIFIMATDALSRLLLKKPNTINEILSIKNFDMLKNFCEKYWENKELEEDDISLIIIKNDNNDIVEHIIPSANFSFPNKVEPDFVPFSLINNSEQILTDMQIQEIFHQFAGVANDFREVKFNQKIMQILLIIAIILSLLNLAVITSYMVFSGKEQKKPIEQTDGQMKIKDSNPQYNIIQPSEPECQ